ncbi:MAG: hypothetical protein LBG91_01290 [Treponema sp.]|nr:hypothetical protein [Treponema sp.]
MKKSAFPVRFICLLVCGISIASLSLLVASCHEPYVDKDKVYTITFFHDNAHDNGSQLVASAETVMETDMKGKLSDLPPTPAKPNDLDPESGEFIRSYAFVGWFTTGGTEVSLKTVFHTDTLVVAKWKASDEVDKNAIGPLAEDLAFLRNADVPTEIELLVYVDEDIKTQFLGFGGQEITIKLRGIPNPNIPTLYLSGFGAIFIVEKGVTLELGNIVLQGSRNTSSLIVVNSGGKCIMNDGTVIKGNGNEKKEFGGGVTVNMGGVFEMKGGLITENYAADPTEDWVMSTSGGGGVQVRGGTFYMTGGQITENQGFNGGGVLVNRGGKFYMGPFPNRNTDGDIYKNYADSGGGVKVLGGINNLDHPNSPTDSTINSEFHMEGAGTTRGRIAENQGIGGGVAVGFRGTFYLKGGIIENNLGSDGGGLSNSRGVVYMYDEGDISRNRGPWSAGGVMNQGFFYMYGGRISDNFGGLGGGVSNFMPALLGLGGWFHMWGGEISGNTADGSGGAVVNTGFFNMHGGEIYGNKTNIGNGAGIYNGSPGYDEDGIFVITGGVIYGAEMPAGFDANRPSTAWDIYKNVDRGGSGGSFYVLGGQVVWGRRGYYELVEGPDWQWMTQEQRKAEPLKQFIKTGSGETDFMYTFIPDTRYEENPVAYQGRSFVPDISKGKPEIVLVDYDDTRGIKVPSISPVIKDVYIPGERQNNNIYTNKTYEVIHWDGSYPASGPLTGESIVTGTTKNVGVYIDGLDGLIVVDFNDTEWKGNAP